jgi:hypothetical protein
MVIGTVYLETKSNSFWMQNPFIFIMGSLCLLNWFFAKLEKMLFVTLVYAVIVKIN